VRNHIIDFLVSRSKGFAEEVKGGGYDRRQVPVVRPGAPEPMIAADANAFTPSGPDLNQEPDLIRGRA